MFPAGEAFVSLHDLSFIWQRCFVGFLHCWWRDSTTFANIILDACLLASLLSADTTRLRAMIYPYLPLRYVVWNVVRAGCWEWDIGI